MRVASQLGIGTVVEGITHKQFLGRCKRRHLASRSTQWDSHGVQEPAIPNLNRGRPCEHLT